jgi:hypothetical protein
MPKYPPAASTLRQHELADFINLFGEIIVKKCSTCVKANWIYQVHVRLGKCRACNKLSQRYDIKVTQSEFQRLAAEKICLKKEIQELQDLQEEEFYAYKKALERMRVARAKEERLRQQIDLLNCRADKAIAVEEGNI